MVCPDVSDEPFQLLTSDPAAEGGSPRPNEDRASGSVKAPDLVRVGVRAMHLLVPSLPEELGDGFLESFRRSGGKLTKDAQTVLASAEVPGPAEPPQDRHRTEGAGRLLAGEGRERDRPKAGHKAADDQVPDDELMWAS
jgi:hypothetical protein